MSIMSRNLRFTFAAAAVVVALVLSTHVARGQDAGPAAPAPPQTDQQAQPAQPGQPGQPPTTGPEQPKGPTLDEAALAERFAEMAQAILSNPNRPITENSWKESA